MDMKNDVDIRMEKKKTYCGYDHVVEVVHHGYDHVVEVVDRDLGK